TTVAAASGVATFSTLSLNLAGTGYTLTAAANGLTGATSGLFNIIARVTVGPQLSVGLFYACGVTTSGAAYCWGSAGHLGNGPPNGSDTPVAVSGGLSFATVSASYDHACGVTTGGAAYCWGYNGVGELGNGSNTSSAIPVAISGGLSFAAVS